MQKKINKYENKTTKIINRQTIKIGDSTDNIIKKLEQKHTYLLDNKSFSERIIELIAKKTLEITNIYYDYLEPYFDFARTSTKPLHYPYFLYKKKKGGQDKNVLFADGVHFFVALQGGGKSSISYELITQILRTTGKSAYVNAHFEKPRYDPIKREYYKHFQFFKLLDFFDMSVKDDDPNIEVSQLKKFNRHFDTIVLDEWLTEMNHRMNRTSAYNNVFMALLTMIAHMRHQKMKRIYVLSQIDNTDIQLLSMFKYIHELEIDLDVSYSDWVASGSFKRHIMGWYVWTYGVSRNKKQQRTDKVLIKKQYIKATADFDYFETLAQAEKYDSLPEDKIDFM